MLGLSLHGWENSMVVFLIIAGFFALIAGVATWAVVSLQRIEIAESNARQTEAELKLEQLRKLSGPRDIKFDVFQKELEGKPKAPVTIWYLPDSSDGYWFASRLFSALSAAKWTVAFPATIPDLDEKNVEAVVPTAPEKLLSILRGMPRAMNAGGQPSGVTVVTGGNPDLNGPEETPFRALIKALSKSTEFGVYGSGGSQFMPVPEGTLRVIVAAKTDPMFVTASPPSPPPK